MNYFNKKKLLYILSCLAIIFFVLYKFLLIDIMWHDRQVPPEPDDSYAYIKDINLILSTQNLFTDLPGYPKYNLERIKSISYNIILANVALMGNISAEDVYHYNFYIGIVILAFFLFYLLNKIFTSQIIASIGLIFFAFYQGDGAFHGFFWVVPTFFSALGFLFLISQLFTNYKKGCSLIILFLPFFIFTHFFSLYTMLFFMVLLIINSLFNKTDNKQTINKKILTIIAISFILYLLVFIFYSQGMDSGYSPINVAQTTIHNSQEKIFIFNREAVNIFKLDFINNFLPPNYNLLSLLNPFLLFFVFGAISMILSKKKHVFFLFLAILLFSIIGLINLNGYRLLIYLWPITFLIFIYIFYFLLREKKVEKKIIFLVFAFLIIYFINEMIPKNINHSEYVNHRNNLKAFDNSCIDYLNTNVQSNETVFFADKLSLTTILGKGFFKGKTAYKGIYFPTDEPSINKYIISSRDNEEFFKKVRDLNNKKTKIIQIKNCGFLDIKKIVKYD